MRKYILLSVIAIAAIVLPTDISGQNNYDKLSLIPDLGLSLRSELFEYSDTPISDRFSRNYTNGFAYGNDYALYSKLESDTNSIVKKRSSFAENNTGAFKSKKKGGTRSPGMAALCSGLVPGLGQFYNGQWYKPPILYAGVAVIAYFIDVNIKERKIYDKELRARHNSDTLAFNPDLTSYTKDNLLDIRNYYEQNFELTLIIAGVVYLLNIVDAVVYAHLFDFNVSPNLSMRIEPYASPNFSKGNSNFPLDMGLKMSLTLK